MRSGTRRLHEDRRLEFRALPCLRSGHVFSPFHLRASAHFHTVGLVAVKLPVRQSQGDGQLVGYEHEKTEFFTGGKDVQALGREKRWTPTRSGTLYLRINSQASRLHDNSGNVEITVSRIDSDEKGRKRGGK